MQSFKVLLGTALNLILVLDSIKLKAYSLCLIASSKVFTFRYTERGNYWLS